MTRPPRSKRRGFTLIEMVMIIAGAATMITLCGGFLHLLLRLEGSGRSALTDASNVARLARQFRADVRGSTVVKVVPGVGDAPTGLDLSDQGAPVIAYRQEGEQVLRTEREGDRVVRRESYRFGRLGPARFLVEPDRVRLDLPRVDESSGTLARPGFTIEARLGKHRIRGEGGAR